MFLKLKARVLLFLVDSFKKGFFSWILLFILSAIFVFIGSMLNPFIENKGILVASVLVIIIITGMLVKIFIGRKTSERFIKLLLKNSNFGKPVCKWEIADGVRMYGILYKQRMDGWVEVMVLEGGPSSLTWKKYEVWEAKVIDGKKLGYQLAREYFTFGDNHEIKSLEKPLN